MEHPTSYTLGEAMAALEIKNRRTLDKWLKRFKIAPVRHEHDWRFLVITPQDLARIREARAAMPPVRRREARQPAVLPSLAEVLATRPTPRQRPVVRKESTSEVGDGWEPLPEWCRNHNIPLTTAKNDERLSVTNERRHWRGGSYPEWWLTPEQQEQFHRAYRERVGDPCRACHPSGD